MRKPLYRDFIETMVKMQRNQLLFNQNGIKEVSLTIENSANIDVVDTVITYNVGKQKWIVNSETHHLENNEWDPTLLEVKEFLDYFQDFEILVSMQNYEDKVKKYFEKIPATNLVSKFSDVLRLMTIEQNNKKPLPSITFNNNEIYYDFESNEFFIITNGEEKSFDFPDIADVLANKNYLEAFEALNDTWKNLVI